MDKHKGKLAAAIDIGSSGVRMHISQWDGRRVVLLDQLEKPTCMGQEVFSTGYISFDTVRDLSDVLAGFCAVAREYDITRINATATTAIREAVNQAYVLDHLSVKNKLDVHVLEDIEANALLFDAMKNDADSINEKVMLVYAGTGTIDFALMNGGKTVFTQSMPTGLLKIAEMLRESGDYSQHTDLIAREYLNTFFTRANFMQNLLQAEDIVFGTGDISALGSLFGDFDSSGANDMSVLQGKTLMKLYEQYCRLSVEQISARHKLNASQAGVLYVTLALLASLLQMTKIKKIYYKQINLADAVLNLILRPGARRSYNESLRAGAVSSALELSARYCCDLEHSRHVTKFAMTLFENLRRTHGFSRQQGLLLQTACILHESGYYTNTADLQETSYDLVKDAQIYGLRAHETLLAANIISPRSLLGVARDSRRVTFSREDELFINKMHAILHLADALDYSRKQKAELFSLEQKDASLILSLRTREDYALEQCMFRQSASLFQEIFGIEPQIVIENSKRMGGNI